jgi:hypothetical protein
MNVLPACMCVYCVCLFPLDARRGAGSLGTAVTDGCELLWEFGNKSPFFFFFFSETGFLCVALAVLELTL